jgi:CzcA family heavy metal efflux pump
MLRSIVRASLHQPVIVLALAGGLLLLGYRTLRETPLDVFPEFAPPLVEVQTEAPGLSAVEVESLITVPLENALNGTAHLKTLRSKSVLGLSSVVMFFEEGTNLMEARQIVQERLMVQAPRLPAVAHPPVMLSPLSSMSRLMKIGVWSKPKPDDPTQPLLSQMDLTELAKWTIRPRLMAVRGVANVAIWGQRDKQFQVLIDPERLRTSGVTMADVERAARDAASVSTGGFIDTPNQRLAVQHTSPILTADDLGRTLVRSQGGSPLTLNDVADVRTDHGPPIGDAIINDAPGLLLIVEKQPWANTLVVTREVEEALESLAPGLGNVELDHTIFRPATFIERALANLTFSMLLGCVLVIVTLAFFLYDWRTALISSTAIPLSLVAGAVVLHLAGVPLNTMVLAGLVIALGEVVDDAIIDVENIIRRLRLNRQAGSPRSAFRVVLAASLEVRGAVVYGTFTVILVILPVFFLTGLAGTFFRPLAIAYVLAILASLVVALTVTPAMCLLLLPGAADRRGESPLVALLKRLYRARLPGFVAQPRWSLIGLAAVTVIAGASVPFLGEEFLPQFKETDFLMHWVEKPGASIEAMDRVTILASKELRAVPGVRNFGSHIGRAEVADEVVGPNFTELWISLDEDVDYQSTVDRVQEIVDGYPGLQRDLLTYLRERIKEVLTGASASIVVRVFGPDLDELRRTAGDVARVMADVPGVSDLKVEAQVLVPQIEVRLKPEAAQRFALTANDVRRAAGAFIKGNKVGEVYHEQKIFDVAVWGVPEVRRDLASLRSLLIETRSGGHVPLGDVADVRIVSTPNEIKREGASRRIDITCNARGRDLGSTAREIRDRVSQLPFKLGYHPEFLGEYKAQAESRRQIMLLSLLSFGGIVLLMYAEFRAWRLVVLVMSCFVFALVGAVAGAWLGGGISLGSLIGLITVLGLSVRNGIMLISHYRHLELHEAEPFGDSLILRGAEERLAPILMTALTTALALAPLVFAGNRPGNEIEHPMALVIFGGLATSTMMNLFLLPALYRHWGRVQAG